MGKCYSGKNLKGVLCPLLVHYCSRFMSFLNFFSEIKIYTKVALIGVTRLGIVLQSQELPV